MKPRPYISFVCLPCCFAAPFNFDFEEDNLSPEDIRNLVLKEIQLLKARNVAREAAKAHPAASGAGTKP